MFASNTDEMAGRGQALLNKQDSGHGLRQYLLRNPLPHKHPVALSSPVAVNARYRGQFADPFGSYCQRLCKTSMCRAYKIYTYVRNSCRRMCCLPYIPMIQGSFLRSPSRISPGSRTSYILRILKVKENRNVSFLGAQHKWHRTKCLMFTRIL